MVYYNMSFTEDTTIPMGLVRGINDNSSGYFIPLILLFIFIALIIAMRNADFKTVMLVDSFIVTLLAGVFFWAELVPLWIAVIPAVVLVVSVFVKMWSE